MNTPSFATVVIHSFYDTKDGPHGEPWSAAPLPTTLHETGKEKSVPDLSRPSELQRPTRRLRVPLHFHSPHHSCSDTVRKLCRRAVERYVSLSCSGEDRNREPWHGKESKSTSAPLPDPLITSPTSPSCSSSSTLPSIGKVFVQDPHFPNAPFVELFPQDMLDQVVHLSTEEIHVALYDVPPPHSPCPPLSSSLPFSISTHEKRGLRSATEEEAKEEHHAAEDDVYPPRTVEEAETTARETAIHEETKKEVEEKEEGKNSARVSARDGQDESRPSCYTPPWTQWLSRKRAREREKELYKNEETSEEEEEEESVKTHFPKNVIVVDIDREEEEGWDSGTPEGGAATRGSKKRLSSTPSAAVSARFLGWGKTADTYFDRLTYCDDPCKARLPPEMLGKPIRARQHPGSQKRRS